MSGWNAFLEMFGRVLLACVRLWLVAYILLFGVPATMLYVWFRLNPRPYCGVLAPRLGLLVSGGALDALEGDL
ncbi:MAG TPA: hypothetical protein VMU38_03180 [Candidatus Binatia bacterium]|nr:hypothetical protein [Candidatus Binatia bacterium]